MVTTFGIAAPANDRGDSGRPPREVVLLVHGLAGSSRTWDSVMPLLAADYDVIAPDLLGHGESAKPIGDYSPGAFASGLRDLLAVLDVPSVTIVGHSYGGGVAMQLAYQHPELVDRLVLVGSGGLGREVTWILRALSLPGAEYVMPLGFSKPLIDATSEIGRLLGRLDIRSPTLGELWRGYRSLAEAPNRQAFVRTMRGVIDVGGQTVSATDRLYLAARVPTLIVWGDRDDDHPGRARPRRPSGDRVEPSRGHRAGSATSPRSRPPTASPRCWSTSSRPRGRVRSTSRDLRDALVANG